MLTRQLVYLIKCIQRCFENSQFDQKSSSSNDTMNVLSYELYTQLSMLISYFETCQITLTVVLLRYQSSNTYLSFCSFFFSNSIHYPQLKYMSHTVKLRTISNAHDLPFIHVIEYEL